MSAPASLDPAGVYWRPGTVRVSEFATSGKRGSSTVRIVLTTSDPWELGDLLRQLAVLRDLPEPKKERAGA